MYNFEFLSKGHMIPAEDAVKIKKSGVRINRALSHIVPHKSYVQIGIDADAGVGCIKPVKDAHNAFSVGSEFGGKVAGRLMEVVGEHPIASVENGMIILRPRNASVPAEPEQREEAEQPKRKAGRPPRPKRVLTVKVEQPKERCENCAYHNSTSPDVYQTPAPSTASASTTRAKLMPKPRPKQTCSERSRHAGGKVMAREQWVKMHMLKAVLHRLSCC